ncbi:hypothetical protein NDU88_003704 [Pleurodeles waltl]|uniref:Uncharacterized protein n=1 Tax=Pleurodeles waltl TaxID=8319 RepID=A0AAV7T6C1_PLEWA|nr:hypothetical protein NDU88_003704 [Pleurodeles waltl]
MEVSKLLAGINAPATAAPPPTTPWGADVSWQNTVADLKRQVDSLVAAHSSNPLQSSSNSPCVALALSICLSSPPPIQNVLPSSSKLPSQDVPAKEGTTDSLLSRPGLNFVLSRVISVYIVSFVLRLLGHDNFLNSSGD